MRHKKYSSIGKDLTQQIKDGFTYATDRRRIDKIAIHCSFSPQGRGDNAHDIDLWHTQKGWDGIGYHYVILEDGTIQKGRWVDYAGAHVKGHNGNSIGICRIGGMDPNDKSKGKRDATPEQIKAIIDLSRVLINEYELSPDDVIGHNEYPKVWKTCPEMDMENIRENLRS